MYHLIISFIFISNIFGDIIERPIQISSNSDYSLSFDGFDDYISINSDLSNFNSFTKKIVLKLNSITNQHTLFHTPNAELKIEQDKLIMVLFLDRNGGETSGQGQPSTNKIFEFNHEFLTNEWITIHLVVEDNDNVKAYINGQQIEITSMSLDAGGMSNCNHSTIGAIQFNNWSDNTDDYFFDVSTFLNGCISSCLLWNKPLSHNEILDETTIDQNNLVLHYDFNGIQYDIAIDNSDNENNGTIIGATWIENIFGCTDELATNYNEEADFDDGSCEYPNNGDYSLSFDGLDDWVEVSNDESLSSYDEITISAWIKLDEFLNDRYMIIEKHSDSTGNTISSGWWLAINDDSDHGYEKQKVQFVLRDEFNNQSVGYSSIVMPLGEYVHIVASYSYESGIQIYINGENYTDLNHSFNFIEEPPMISSNSTSISIGKCRWCNTAFTEKEISQIKIWSNQLNDTDVLSEYNNLNNIDPEAFYNFNSGFGDILYDHSGNENHGTIYGATWIDNTYGCTDELATNYNENANWDDGSCEYYNGPIWYVSTVGSDDNYGSEDSPFASIQKGIDMSADGDSIMVSAGTYYENINNFAKSINIVSTNLENPENTIIDGTNSGTVVYFHDGSPTLNGFKIINGTGSEFEGGLAGGGIWVGGNQQFNNLIISDMTTDAVFTTSNIRSYFNNCTFINNSKVIRQHRGLGMIFTNCEFTNNVETLSNWDGAPIFNKCLFYNNMDALNSFGGTIINVYNCTIINNINAFIASEGSKYYVNSSIIWGNENPLIDLNLQVPGFTARYSLFESIDNIIDTSDVYLPNGYIFDIDSTNIIGNPYIVDINNLDFTLNAISPAIDSGDPDYSLDPDGTRADMGAYYFDQIETPIGCTDELAINYNEAADFDDGSCLYNVGDVNYDSEINIQDIIIMIDYIVEEYPITDYAVFDVIPDGDINILDVVNLIFLIIEG